MIPHENINHVLKWLLMSTFLCLHLLCVFKIILGFCRLHFFLSYHICLEMAHLPLPGAFSERRLFHLPAFPSIYIQILTFHSIYTQILTFHSTHVQILTFRVSVVSFATVYLYKRGIRWNLILGKFGDNGRINFDYILCKWFSYCFQ